ncbi:MAG TPA: aldolase [Burkholderiales bacterium]|jgi:ribulose-5-phosphate 4-epimerase/fuculose-1-phosphate aldolase|nr:aldolase [Burkholderiales bacterium]
MNSHYREHEAREDLVCALRSAERLGLAEGVCNHFSLAVPGRPGHFLINPQGLHWSEVVPADLVIVDAAGNHVSGQHAVEPTAFFIHGRIHHASARAQCVLHTHMPHATALTIVEGGELAWASQNALRFYGRVAYERAYNGLALDEAEGARMAANVQDADIIFLANHGVIVCGPSVAHAFDDLYYLERACELQLLGESSGRPLKLVPQEIAAATRAQMDAERQQSDLHLAALKRILDREQPEWRGKR